MADLGHSIKKELQESGPLTAKQLAQRLGKSKKEINRTVYDMERRRVVERTDPSEEPPRWQLRHEHTTPVTSQPLDNVKTGCEVHEAPRLVSAEPLQVEQVHTPPPQQQQQQQATPPPVSVLPQSEEELKQRVLQVLCESRESISALTIARQLGLSGRGDVNPILYKLKDEGIVKLVRGSKPLWQLVTVSQGPVAAGCDRVGSSASGMGESNQIPSDGTGMGPGGTGMGPGGPGLGPIATWPGREGSRDELYTRKDSEDGTVAFTPVRQEAVLNRVTRNPASGQQVVDGSGTSRGGNEEQAGVPIQETANANAPIVEVKGKGIDPVNLLDVGQIQISESDSKGALSETNGNKKMSNKKRMAACFPGKDQSATPTPTNQSKSATTPPDRSTLRRRILELLRSANETLSTEEISNRLGLRMRADALGILRELECEDKVRSSKVGDINHWRLNTGV